MVRIPPQSRSPVAVLILVVGLALSGGVAATGAPTSAPTVASPPGETAPASNTTNFAVPPSEGPTNLGYEEVNVDVASAVALSSERLHTRHENLTFQRRYRKAGSEDARLGLVARQITQVERRLDRLDARHDRLLQSYSNGTVSRAVFLRRLARLKTSAVQSQSHLDRIEGVVDSDTDTDLSQDLTERLETVRAELVSLRGPLTGRTIAALSGQHGSFTIYVEGRGSGLVLAAIDDEQFVREATLRSEYAPDQPSQFEQPGSRPISLAFDRVQNLYPWVFANLNGINSISGFGNADVYLFDLGHPHGVQPSSLRTYIHGATTNVFQEHHWLYPERIPVRTTLENETATLTLTANATTRTGPMRVTVTEGVSDRPADVTVRVNGDVVGTTGADGQLWTVRPSGGFRVNATTDEGVSVTVGGP